MNRHNRLKEARFFAKKPQIQLWLETGIHYSTISRLECGYVLPTDEQREKLASALGVEKGWLFPSRKDGKAEFKNKE
jgi:transcriptional regulator with XRE-family HTH domain